MKKLILFLTLLFVGISANAQYTPSNNLNYVKLLKAPPVGSVQDSVLVYDGSDSFMKMRPSSELITKATPTKSGVVKTDILEADPIVYTKTTLDGSLKLKEYLSTGLLKNGLITINADPTKIDISAGIGIISNFDDPENPISEIISFPAFTGITPTYLNTGNITYVAITKTPSIQVLMQSTPFTSIQRRDLIILGAAIHSNLTNVNVVNNISAPSNAIGNQLHDFIEAVGALNLTGNKYSANGANLQLNKSAGTIFKFGVNFANDWKNPHQLAQGSGTALTFRYRTQNGTEGSDVTSVSPGLYDNANVLTAVPNNKFTIQTVVMFQTGLTRILYGQQVYDDLATAKNAIFTRNFNIEANAKENGVVRAYIIIKNNTTSLLTTTDAEIIEAQKFGGVASGGVALTLANIVSALGYTPENASNKQNSLTVDGSGVKYPTIDAVNSLFTTPGKTNQNVFVGVRKSTSNDALNNYEFSMARMADGTIVRAGVYSTTRYEQVFGAYVGFSKSSDDGKTWSSVTTVYTSVGETVELPTIGVVGTRIVILFRTTTGGVNTYTNGTAKTAYSDNTGTSWTIGSNIVSPASVILLPYGRIDQQGDGKYVAMLHNQNYCEAWETTDGATWSYRSTIYDYRSSPIGGAAILIEPNCVYIGSNKSIIIARNSAVSTTAPMQFTSSDNLGTVVYSGVTNLTDGVSTSLRANNPVALLSDNSRRILYASTATRNYTTDNKIPDVHLIFVSDLDDVFASPTAYVLKYVVDKVVPNGNTYNKGYHSLVLTATGVLGNFTESSVNFKTATDFGNTKINTSYQYSLFLTGTPYDLKSLVNFYPNTRQAKNINTGNYDYITDTKAFALDAEGNVQSRDNSTYVVINNTLDNAVPVMQVVGSKGGFQKYFEVFRNKSSLNVPLFISTTDDSSGALLQIGGNLRAGFGSFTAPATVSGETSTSRQFAPDGASLITSAFMASSVTQYMLLKATGGKPLSLGTTSAMNAIYVNPDGAVKLGSATTAGSWLDLQASTTSHGSISLPTGVSPTTPVSGNVWRSSASVLNFYDGSTIQQFAFLANPAFSGNPTSATPAIGDNDTSIATTAFVHDSFNKTYTVATLPTPTGTAFAVVTDATAPTYLGALTGGGSVVCPVFFNGTIWVSH